MGGYNQSMIADNAIPGRYHIFTVSAADASPYCNYSIVDQDNVNIVQNHGTDIDLESFLRSAATFVRYYESIRGLSRFDPKHCPIIECQWLGGIHHFLQYHRTRDYEPAQFELAREAGKDEIEAILVRGATPPEGIVVNASLYDLRTHRTLLEHEEAAFDFYEKREGVFSELMMRRRGVFFHNEEHLPTFARNACMKHFARSSLFKPGISFIGSFPPKKSLKKIAQSSGMSGAPYHLPMHIISDGRRAFAKVLR